jgi:hypothetical protein
VTKTLTLEGDITAVNTATNLTTQGSVAAPSLVVPSGTAKIDKVVVTVGAAETGAGGACYLLRFGGPAVMNGEQTLVVAGAGFTAATDAGDQAPGTPRNFVLEGVEIAVKASDVIRVQGEMMGTTLGTSSVTVTIVWG